MKMAGAVLVLLAALGIGFQNAARIRKSYEELVYLKKIMIMLRGEISYQISSMEEICIHMGEHTREPYSKAFQNLAEALGSGEGGNFSHMWNETVIKTLRQVIPQENDLDRLKELGENLGYLDKEMQMNYINLYLENLELSITEKGEKVRTDEKLNKIMGCVMGLLVIVLLW